VDPTQHPGPPPTLTARHTPLRAPGDRTPNVIPVRLARILAREALALSASRNTHDNEAMHAAAVDLEWALRQLEAALTAERGEPAAVQEQRR
jgi:pantothenate synthetase